MISNKIKTLILLFLIVLAFGFTVQAQERLNPLELDGSYWLEFSPRDKYMFISGYMASSHSWWTTFEYAPVEQWPNFKRSMEGPVFYEMEALIDFLDRYYFGGGSLPVSIKILEMRSDQ